MDKMDTLTETIRVYRFRFGGDRGHDETERGGCSAWDRCRTGAKSGATFVILAVVLIFKPTGILGRPEVEKV